jgi:glycosyltransferase involved in cell wall biosynthesis/predicted O-methyltransferase YrrM
MRRLKILHVASWYPIRESPYWAPFIREHVRAAATRHECVVLCPPEALETAGLWAMEKETDESLTMGVTTYRLYWRKFSVPWFSVATFALCFVYAAWKLRAAGFAPDVIHVHEYDLGPVAIWLGRILRRPVVASEHTTLFQEGALPELDARRARYTFRNARVVMPDARSLVRAIEKYNWGGRYRFVPNVVDPSLFFPPQSLRRNEGPIRLLFAGILKPNHIKGVPHLLDALHQVSARRTDWHLDLYGDGPARTEYEEKVQALGLRDHVTFHGFQPKGKLAEAMRDADVFVLSSLWENEPCVILEALASGLPIVATAVGDVPDMVDQSSGLLVPPGEAGPLAEALLKILSGSQAYDRRAIAKQAQTFTVTAVGEQLNEVYQDCVHTDFRPGSIQIRLKARLKRLLTLATPVGRLSYRMSHHLETGGLPDCGVPEPAGRFLFSIAKTTPGVGEIVEIGSCFGRSTIFLAAGARHSNHGNVWAIDPHTGDIAWDLGRVSTYEVFLRNIRKFGVENRVKPLKMTSKEAAQGWNGAPIRILFIDGWHSYDAVTEDINLWFPYVISGGLIIFDDYPNPEFPGVRQAVDEQVSKLSVEKPLRISTTLAWTRKL